MKKSASPSIKVSAAKHQHMREIAEIYRFEVLNGVSSWEAMPPDEIEMNRRRKQIQNSGLPYLVAHEHDKLIGFSYASVFRPRSGYRYTVESSIYVATNLQRAGVGSLLMKELIQSCTKQDLRQMLAVIGDSKNTKSINFHLKMGFKKVAILGAIGFRFDRWLDSLIMQLSLGEGSKTSPKQ